MACQQSTLRSCSRARVFFQGSLLLLLVATAVLADPIPSISQSPSSTTAAPSSPSNNNNETTFTTSSSSSSKKKNVNHGALHSYESDDTEHGPTTSHISLSSSSADRPQQQQQQKDGGIGLKDGDNTVVLPARKEKRLMTKAERERTAAESIRDELFDVDVIPNGNGTCDHGIHALWSTQVGSSIVSTPRIVDLHSDGRKELLVPTFTQYVEALDGITGEDVSGFPFTHPDFKSHSSPLPVDIDSDGILEYVVATYGGELVFLQQDGTVKQTVKLHPIPLKKNWRTQAAKTTEDGAAKAAGGSVVTGATTEDALNSGGMDVVGNQNSAVHSRAEKAAKKSPFQQRLEQIFAFRNLNHNEKQSELSSNHNKKKSTTGGDAEFARSNHRHHSKQKAESAPTTEPGGEVVMGKRQLLQLNTPPNNNKKNTNEEAAVILPPKVPLEPIRLDDAGEQKGEGEVEESVFATDTDDDDDVVEAQHYYPYEDYMEDMYEYDGADGVYHGDDDDNDDEENEEDDDYYLGGGKQKNLKDKTIGVNGWLSKEALASMDLVYHPELYASMASSNLEKDPLATANTISDTPWEAKADEILVDAHILSTPVLVDLDQDGLMDVVVHVSYFFDSDFYNAPENQFALPEGISIDDYVADAIVSVSPITGAVQWLQLLHVAPRSVTHPPYGLSSPVVTNINGDFALDTFLTTTSGKIYGFGEGGNVLPGWPVQMSSIVASCVAEDVDGDGQIEICAADVRGTVACFASNGRLKWETHVAGGVVETPTLGDVNGDGILDLVVGTSAGAIYALHGKTGAVLENFPILAGGPVVAPALLLNLNLTAPPALPSAAKGLHVVVPSMDGILYVISGTTGCYEAIDIGEKSTTMVLAEDLTGNGLVDLVVTTMSGSVLVYSTETPFHPLKAWTSRTKMLSSVTASEGYVGVFIEPESRTPRDIRGDRFQLLVTIRDERPNPHPNIPRRYTLTVLIGTRIIVFSGMFFEAKTYPLALHAPLQRMYATVRVVLSLPNGQHFEDSTSFGFNMHFLETIKYVLLVPFVLFVVAMSLVKKEHGVTMMSYNNSRGSQQQQQYQRSRRYYEEESIL